jgi:3-oxoacyl-[acyl-carrier-protein] synthase III
MSNKVYITRMAKCLPNKPVSNDEMEGILGYINGSPSKARPLILRNNQIKNRYYALDKNGLPTHTNAELTKLAIENLFTHDFHVGDMEVLSCGTTSPDQLLPSHTAMVHGVLGGNPVEINSTTGACSAGIQALKFGYLSVLSGDTENAVCAGSERLSPWMLAKYFKEEAEQIKLLETKPIIAFEKDFLRFMLSDGAGAALLRSAPNPTGISLKIEWIMQRSFANELEVCMYAGAVKNGSGHLKGWGDMEQGQWASQSVFAMKQDTKLLGEFIVKKASEFLKEVSEKKNLDFSTVKYFLPHLSSQYFASHMVSSFKEFGIDLPASKWFTNLSSVGNVGAASPFLMLEEIFNSGRLNKGDTLLMGIPESARFNYAAILLTVV